MSLLFRYLFRNNLLLILPTLAIGTGLYILSDLFDRLDDFLEAGVSFRVAVWYFVAKTPLIVSQILPAVFLLATLAQLCLMSRGRELIALQAGGVSLGRVARSLVVCGMAWAVVQLGFSQVLGVSGELEAARIWSEDVRGKTAATATLRNVWFTDGPYVVNLAEVVPAKGEGQELAAYELSPDGQAISRVIRAATFTANHKGWTLQGVTVFDPSGYLSTRHDTLTLPLRQDVQAFLVTAPNADPSRLPLWQLGHAIERLSESGSNVEGVRTAWHMKLAYAASLVVMAVVAAAMVTWRDNIYLCIGLALVITFIFYSMFTVGGTLGQKGIVSPPLAAWGADALILGIALARLAWFLKPRFKAA
ncbi:LptF/LptG family permease [Nitratidesulfovibrio sp. HK-II]|uniref:LptF/LptG family permease n=1 Tax=Nitratidesulfovibrio sp. HK-II TaxID=2009266 RepID=UPI000E2FE78C|nr:LptF/LptG family permease [Nitratidesulfovibrio sp. HK-II]GBO95922.1 predicted permease YjgP/YjgQ family [Nitratidesulfovibrio sp. HK-II]